jgi:hypothetical protein
LAGGVRPSYHVNIEHRKKTQAKVEENNAAYLSYCILGSKELLFRKRVTFALNLFKCGGMLKDYRIKSNTTDSEAEFDSGFGVETYSLIDSQTDRQTDELRVVSMYFVEVTEDNGKKLFKSVTVSN